MEKLNVAVVGAGIFGAVHIRSYQLHTGANLVKVCEVNPKRANAVKREYKVDVCSDYQEIADDPNIQAVSIATPDFLHRDVVIAMLKAGKHVMVEKPLATSTTEAGQMVKAADKAGKALMVDFQNRWNPPFIEARNRIVSGEFGEPVTAFARLANTLFVPKTMLSWSGKSGPHWFLFPHIIDMICWLFDKPVKSAMAFGRKGVLSGMGMDTYDALQAMLFFDGACATVETSWIIPESRPNVVDFRVDLQGTKEVMQITPLSPTIAISGPKAFQWPVLSGFQDAHGRLQGWQTMPVLHFVDSLLAGKEPMCTAREGYHNTAIVEAIVKSADSGKPVAVKQL